MGKFKAIESCGPLIIIIIMYIFTSIKFRIQFYSLFQESLMNYSRVSSSRLAFGIDKISLCCNFATAKSMSEFQPNLTISRSTSWTQNYNFIGQLIKSNLYQTVQFWTVQISFVHHTSTSIMFIFSGVAKTVLFSITS